MRAWQNEGETTKRIIERLFSLQLSVLNPSMSKFTPRANRYPRTKETIEQRVLRLKRSPPDAQLRDQ